MDKETVDRVKKYIEGMKKRLENVSVNDEKLLKIYNLARQYTEDAEYYLTKGDVITALVDVVYAEGLLDSVLMLTGQDPDSQVSKRVFVGGTFDLIHPGHIEFLREAAKYGRVYVAISRNVNAERIKKRPVINDENERLEVVRAIRYVYDALLGDEKDFLNSVLRVRPHVIFLGPDQKVDEKILKEELRKRGLENVEIIRMEKRINKWKHSSSSQIISEILKKFCENEENKNT